MPTEILIQDDDLQEICIPVGQDQADKLLQAFLALYSGADGTTTVLTLLANVPGSSVTISDALNQDG